MLERPQSTYSEAVKMLYFTGWGLTAEGMLKPDTARWNVCSAIPDGSYDLDTQVRVYLPHAAGATALIKQADNV